MFVEIYLTVVFAAILLTSLLKNRLLVSISIYKLGLIEGRAIQQLHSL